MNQICSLNEIPFGGKATVSQLSCPPSMRRRFLDIGLVEHTQVECVGKSPLGDPRAYLIRGAVIALRARDAAGITLECDAAALPAGRAVLAGWG